MGGCTSILVQPALGRGPVLSADVDAALEALWPARGDLGCVTYMRQTEGEAQESDHKKEREQSGRLPGSSSTVAIVSPGVAHMSVQAAVWRQKGSTEEDLPLS